MRWQIGVPGIALAIVLFIGGLFLGSRLEHVRPGPQQRRRAFAAGRKRTGCIDSRRHRVRPRLFELVSRARHQTADG